MSLSTPQKVARNSAFSAGRYVLGAALVLVIAPYAVDKLGTARFGIWALSGVLTTYVRLGDFGISRALVKYVAELQARDDTFELSSLVTTALALYTPIGVLLGVLFLAVHQFALIRIFHVPAPLQAEASRVFIGVVIVAVIDLVFSTFQSVLEGLQEIHTASTITGAQSIVSVLGVVIALEMGYGLMGLVVKNAIISVLAGIACWIMVRRCLQDFQVRPRFIQFKWLKQLLHFGSHIQVVNIVSLLIEPFNKILLSSFLSLSFVAYYEIAVRIINQLVAGFQALALALYPATAEAEVKEGRQAVTWIYTQATRYMTLLALPIFTVVILLAPGFVSVWLGPDYALAGRSLQFLALGWMVAIPSTIAYLTALGIGQPQLSMLASVTTAVASAVIGFVLLKLTGYLGLMAGNALGSILGSLAMFLLFHSAFGIPYTVLRRAILNRAVLLTIVLGLGLYVVTAYVTTWTIFLLFALGGLYLLFYVIGIIGVGYLDHHDRSLLLEVLPARAGAWIGRFQSWSVSGMPHDPR